ncbi:ABC transporter, ATP-binding protein [Lachnospiraceae bacterium KM106-2]|nr:ABC transporter, ATP-binding protein [Lachnospiraceae bacterium KM106-2]
MPGVIIYQNKKLIIKEGIIMKLEVKDLKKSFGDTEILHGISFEATQGKALGLLGRNGAGKTTTIRILMDVFKANSGTITLDGKPFVARDYQIGYLPEERGLYPKKTVEEQILYLACLRGVSMKKAKANCDKWLDKLGVLQYKNRKLDTLSKGNQQKVQIAQTLVCDPDIVILDEPFSGLDPVNSQVLKDTILELIQNNKIVIFSSHQMGYVEEFCEDIVIINKGEVVLGGNLAEIKKEYGKDRLTLSAVNYDVDELAKICKDEFSSIFEIDQKKNNFLIIKLIGSHTKKDIMEALIKSDIDINEFSTYRPTLTDIFVLKAGDQQ